MTLFINNKYTAWYFSIITNARVRTTSDNTEYHHILPKSIWPKYANLRKYPLNGVNLTYREHFICHWLLTKMTKHKKKAWAAMRFLMKNGKHKRNSRTYELLKKRYVENVLHGDNNPMKKRKHVDKLMKNRKIKFAGLFEGKAHKIHNNKYDYSKVIYEAARSPIIIICPEHGEFSQLPNDHLSGKTGCKDCSNIDRSSSIIDFWKDKERIPGNKGLKNQ